MSNVVARTRAKPLTVGLAVAEIQTLHHGHNWLLATMAANCDVSILALGSADKSGILGHPFGFEQRKAMVQAIYGDIFQFVQLHDIDASADDRIWMGYVLDRLGRSGLPVPTDYFTGHEVDALWYASYFPSAKGKGRSSGAITTYSGLYRQSEGGDVERRLHIVNRDSAGFPSGRDIRFLIERRDEEWKNHVPAKLWDYIEWNYPPQLRQPVRGGMVPDSERYPVGTRFVQERHVFGSPSEMEGVVQVLRDDGVWRVSRQETDEKAEAARRMHEAFENRK